MGLREKLTQVYTYLYELYKLRNPVICEIKDHLWLRSLTGLPRHPCLSVHLCTDSVIDHILKIRRPDLEPPPQPPPEIKEWLRDGWNQFGGKVVIKEILTHKSQPYSDPIARFVDDPSRVNSFKVWKEKYDKWTDSERSARATLKLYQDLYDLKLRMDDEPESYELILGDGMLDWPVSDRTRIYHPILLQRVKLEFNPGIPEFSIVESEHAAELYADVFSYTNVSATLLRTFRQTLEQKSITPKNGGSASSFLKEIASQIAPLGKFVAEVPLQGKPNAPQITRSPILFLRRRTMGMGLAIQSILEDVQTRTDFPSSIARIVGVEHLDQEADQEYRETNIGQTLPDTIWYDEEEDVLFTKEANEEQQRIARRLDKFGAVLVQGPPGTGKTHTIANLLGHLLAQGKSVLVTAHTEKALKVLRDKVVEPLRPLCVSILSDSHNQMEAAVDAIIERLSQSDAEELEREAAHITQQRKTSINALKQLRRKLVEARNDEYRPIMFANTSYHPSKAARMVKERAGIDSWIPGPIASGEPMPLTDSEIIELYRTNSITSNNDEELIDNHLPDLESILPPFGFEKMVMERDLLAQNKFWHHKEYWIDGSDNQTPERLDAILTKLLNACETITNSPDWLLSVIEAGKERGYLVTTWSDLLLQIKNADEMALNATTLFYRSEASIPQKVVEGRNEKVLDDIIDYLEQGNKLNKIKLLFNKDWKEFIESARINRRPPSTIDDFYSLRTLIQFNRSRAELLERWKRQVTSLGGPTLEELGPEPEKTCRQFIPLIRQKLLWHSAIWTPLVEETISAGFKWNDFLSSIPPDNSTHGDLRRIRNAVNELSATFEAQKKRLQFQQIVDKWKRQEHSFERISTTFAGSEIVQQLVSAFKVSDTDSYSLAYKQLSDLHTRRKLLQLRRLLLQKMERTAPGWADSIRKRSGIHGQPNPPGPASSAWEWRQLNDELDRRATISLEGIQSQIDQSSSELKEITIELVEKMAWAAQLRRTNLHQQQALSGWKDIMHRIGKSTGLRVPLLLAEARRLTPVCQTAIPVWIMSLNQVAESFDPRKNRFDVVIIDEASQADVMAMTALYLGKKVVIVGDNQQVSPMAIGQNIAQVQNLISQYLNEIPNSINYDGQMSIYNLAQASFTGTISLREHFRCVPQIINYSNWLSYDWKIRPLRDYSKVKSRPATIACRIEGATLDGNKVNEKEARHIASLVAACIEQPEYQDATFGIITMLGDDQRGQAGYINKILSEIISPTEIERRQISCGNAYYFQGDERDVIFISTVTPSKSEGQIRHLAAGTASDRYKKRFNVAVSRARDQIWVVHSLDPETDLQPGDLRRDLIMYARNPEAYYNRSQPIARHAESEFERLVRHSLMKAGYRVTSPWTVGALRIDLVVEGGGERVAIECDGDRLRQPENLFRDMTRQSILERLGWRFIRIRGSEFFRNQDDAMKPVFTALEMLNIPPEGNLKTGLHPAINGEELKDRIIRRASEIRHEIAKRDLSTHDTLA